MIVFRSRILTSVFSFVFVSAILPGSATAQPDKDGKFPSILHRDLFLQQYGYGDVVVATVVKVSGHEATNSNPPLVALQVHEVWRGDKKTDRQKAIWKPVFSPFCANDPQVLKWLNEPLAGPKVGEKWIVWGHMEKANGQQWFGVGADARFPWSVENEKKARLILKQAEQTVREFKAEQEAAAKKAEEVKAAWRATIGAKDIAKFAAEADFVGIGKRISDQGPTYQVTEILKGVKRIKYDGNTYYVEVGFAKKVEELLDRETSYVLFLKDTSKPVPASRVYSAISSGDGIVIADAESIKAVRASLK
jgi:hypothetical protein